MLVVIVMRLVIRRETEIKIVFLGIMSGMRKHLEDILPIVSRSRVASPVVASLCSLCSFCSVQLYGTRFVRLGGC